MLLRYLPFVTVRSSPSQQPVKTLGDDTSILMDKPKKFNKRKERKTIPQHANNTKCGEMAVNPFTVTVT